MVNIVTVNVSQTIPAAPSQLQRTGAMVSCGGTTAAPLSLSLLTQESDLTALLSPAHAITSLTWASGVVTVVTAAPHGIPSTEGGTGVVIAGATPSGYNGEFPVAVVSTTSFTYALVGNPGAETVPGTYRLQSVFELEDMANTFFAQGAQQAVYVLELGPCYAASPLFVAQLSAFIAANPARVYAYLMPRDAAAGSSSFLAYLSLFDSPTAKTYFFLTTTSVYYTSLLPQQKAGFALVEAPAVFPPAGVEMSVAAAFYKALSYAPASTNQVSPMCYSYQYGVTPYPTPGNAAILSALAAANINVIGTGAEGGISNTILLYGTTLDGNDFTHWYSVDWVQINSELQLSNAVINGSNNLLAPLYYNQPGVNRLQAVEVSVMRQAISDGLALGQLVATKLPAAQFIANVENGVYAGNVVVNAEPFSSYVAENPDDYAIGKYGGISVGYTPARGFRMIVVNINVSNFAGS